MEAHRRNSNNNSEFKQPMAMAKTKSIEKPERTKHNLFEFQNQLKLQSQMNSGSRCPSVVSRQSGIFSGYNSPSSISLSAASSMLSSEC